MELYNYLLQHHRKSTAESYYRAITIYLKQNKKAKTASYHHVVDYLGEIRKQGKSPHTIKAILNAIKKYYRYLNHTGQRKDHPCNYLNLKDKLHNDAQLQDLFTAEELEELLGYEPKRFKNQLEIKNKTLLSLLIYQALTRSNINGLTVKDIYLEKGTIYIKSTSNTNSRTLKLKSNQVMLFYKYIHEIRPMLLKLNDRDTAERLFIGRKGKDEAGDSIKHLLQGMQSKFPGRKLNPITIRQSVIANLLKQKKDIRIVQSFAGHKNPSATERYKQGDTEELQHLINKYHPIK